MKWSLSLTGNYTQFNMTAETPHEEELCKLLNKFEGGTVRIHQGVEIAISNGGYLREYEHVPKTCAITINRPKPVECPAGLSQEAEGSRL